MKKFSIGLLALLAFLLRPIVSPAQSPSVERAKAEREVTLYGSTNASVMQKVIQSFEKKYPFLKVNYARTRGDKVMQRIVTEQRAGRYLARGPRGVPSAKGEPLRGQTLSHRMSESGS